MNYQDLKVILEFARNYFFKHHSSDGIYDQQILAYVAWKYIRHYDVNKGSWQLFVVMLVEQKWRTIKKAEKRRIELEAIVKSPPDDPEELKGYDDEPEDKHLFAFYKLQLALAGELEGKVPIIKKYIDSVIDSVPSLSIPALNRRKTSECEFLNNLDYYKFKTWLDIDNSRYFQELALQQMIMHGQLRNEHHPGYMKDGVKNGAVSADKKKLPTIGAVLVSEDGNLIASSHGGCECYAHDGCVMNHCEDLLFDNIFNPANLIQAKSGTLFITLEPSVSSRSGEIPCVVRCLESGIKKIYVGTFNPNKAVNGEGIRILRTGAYQFDKRTSCSNQHGKELRQYLEEKEYREVNVSATHTFLISEPVQVLAFDADLTLEIIKRNEPFIKLHSPYLY